MGEISEKILYGEELREMSYRFGYEVFVWAEDLAGKKLYVYQDNVRDAAYKLHIELGECGLLYINSRSTNYLRCLEAKCSVEEDIILISVKQFSQYWKEMRFSVERGIRAAEDDRKVDQIPDLSLLTRPGSVPVIKNNKVIFMQEARHDKKPRSPEDEKLRRSRQSAMDNPKLIYCYSNYPDAHIYHDKLCEDVRRINDYNFCASAVPPEGRRRCPKCAQTMFIRQVCGNRPKQIPFLRTIFQKEHIHADTIQNFAERGYVFHASALDEIHVFCNEDNWIVRKIGAIWTLWHNNYERVSETERYITKGYHDQNFINRQLYPLLQFIGNYTWEGHLEAENAKKIAAEENRLRQEQLQSSFHAEKTKCGIMAKIRQWLQKHFGRKKK